MRNQSIKAVVVSSLIGMLFYSSGTYADDHAWGTYHWERSSNPFTIPIIDSVSNGWQYELDIALAEWDERDEPNTSSVLSLVIDSANDTNRTRRRCRMKSGQIRVCNASYGFNGWLGLATIGIKDGHITQGTAKVNDSYSSYWANTDDKRHVMCQEIGHLFGLDHTTTDGSSQKTCMDYSSDPESVSPNQDDYAMLETIYAELDNIDDGETSGTCNAPPGKGCNKPNAGVGQGSDGPPPMGVRVHKGEHEEIWVAPNSDGGLWIHHIRLVPDEFRIVR